MERPFKWGLIGDLQIPYHDPRAVALFMKAMKWWKPDAITALGDIADFLEYSSFSDGTTDEFFNVLKKSKKEVVVGPDGEEREETDAEFYKRLNPLPFAKESAAESAKFYQSLRKQHPNAEIHACLGNHECFSMENHRVITPNGYASWNEIEPGDLVLSCEDDGTAVWQEVTDVHLYPDDESSLYKFDCNYIRGEFTENHRFITRSTYKAAGFREHTTEEFVGQWGGIFAISVPNSAGDTPVSDEEIRELAHGLSNADYSESLMEDVKDFSERQVRVLMDEWHSIDKLPTHKHGSTWSVACADKHVREVIRWVLTLNGIGTFEDESVHGFWVINAVDKTNRRLDYVKMNHRINRVESKGVWCITVPNGRFFVEAFGATHLTGNCRIFKYVDKKMPEYLNEITPDSLWGFDNLGITYSEYDKPPVEKYGGIHVHHGATVSSSGLAVRGDIEKYNISLARGHDHLGGVVYKSYPMSNLSLVGIGAGHMCDPSQYGLSYTINPAWELGFAVVSIVDGQTYPQFIPIKITDQGYTCVLDGRVFHG